MNLVYSFCFGSPFYFEMAQVWASSVRAQGFDGDVVILSDRPWSFEGAENKVVTETRNRLWKSAIVEAVELEKYDRVLYLDTDVLCVSSLDWAFEYEGVSVAKASTLLHASPGTSCLLSEREVATSRDMNLYGINTGTIVFPGKIAREFLLTWEKRWRSADKQVSSNFWEASTHNQLMDEAVLQLMYFRREISLELIPQEKVLFPILVSVPGYSGHRFSERTALIHFLSTSIVAVPKENILRHMKQCLIAENIPGAMAELEDRSRILMARGMEVFTKMFHDLEASFKTLVARVDGMEKRLAEHEARSLQT